MPDAISPDRLRLASHIRACNCGRGVILLDLQRDRYLGVTESVSRALAGRVDGWPVHTGTAEDAETRQDAFADGARSLLSQGILTKHLSDPPPMINLEDATASMDVEVSPAFRSFGTRRLLQFTTSVAIAAWGLRYRSLQTVAHLIAARRAQLLMPEAESLQGMRSSVAAYEALRPFVFTAREKCLLDSLTLVTFLAKEGFAPRWVIGVKVGPFGAHSWVQCGKTVLNDQHAYVRQFRPILVV